MWDSREKVFRSQFFLSGLDFSRERLNRFECLSFAILLAVYSSLFLARSPDAFAI